jgi:Outer membrane protein beta-barrel domain
VLLSEKSALLMAPLLLGVTAWAQEHPKAELSLDYTYANYAPSARFSAVHNQSLNGGGGAIVYNLSRSLGLKADLQGYGSFTNSFLLPASPNFPTGSTASVQGNLFTYLFGPQFKTRAQKAQPFFHVLVGGAHSNLYANTFQLCGMALRCQLSQQPSNNAFALALGGGVDIPLKHGIQLRPLGLDYLQTNFTNPFNSGNQHNFRYLAGMTFTFGGLRKE